MSSVTTINLTSVVFDEPKLRAAIARVPREMAKEVGNEVVTSFDAPKSGKVNRRTGRRRSKDGESPANDRKKLKNSKRFKKTGEFSIDLSFDTPYSNRLQYKINRPILPDSKVPEWEARQKKKFEKILV